MKARFLVFGFGERISRNLETKGFNSVILNLGMKKIIDPNFFRDPSLEAYLRADKENIVVFNDHACMEAYKGNAIENIFRSIEIVSKFPDQVIVLKGTRGVVKLTLSPGGFYRLEDSDQTKGFKTFCQNVQQAVNGDEALAAQIIKKGHLADRHLDTSIEEASNITEGIRLMGRSFQPGHLKALRRGEKLPIEVIDKIMRDILLLTAFLFQKHPDVLEMPQASQVRNTFTFRFAISTHLLGLRWISEGGPGNITRDKLRNDVVDMVYVAYATFFDGLLTRDKKMQQIYQEVCLFLEHIFS